MKVTGNVKHQPNRFAEEELLEALLDEFATTAEYDEVDSALQLAMIMLLGSSQSRGGWDDVWPSPLPPQPPHPRVPR